LGGCLDIESDDTGTIVMAHVPMMRLGLPDACELSSVLNASSGETGCD
jgi:hypothetical protein